MTGSHMHLIPCLSGTCVLRVPGRQPGAASGKFREISAPAAPLANFSLNFAKLLPTPRSHTDAPPRGRACMSAAVLCGPVLNSHRHTFTFTHTHSHHVCPGSPGAGRAAPVFLNLYFYKVSLEISIYGPLVPFERAQGGRPPNFTSEVFCYIR